MTAIQYPPPNAPNKLLYYDAAGQPQLEDYLRDQSFNMGVSAVTVGDLTVAYSAQSFSYDKRGKWVDLFGQISFTPTYTSTAWAASTAVTVGTRRTNGGNVYEVITAGTTAASGGPTGTTASITDGTAVWKYISVATTGSIVLTGLPFVTDAAANRIFLNAVSTQPLTFANNGTVLYANPNASAQTMSLLAGKTAASAQAGQMSSSQFASGTLFALSISGRYKAAA